MAMIEFLIFAVLFASFAIVNLYRFIKGPTAADRIVATDAADIMLSCAMVLFSLYSGRGIYLDVSIISAMLGIINTMLVGRYLDKGRWVKKHDSSENNN